MLFWKIFFNNLRRIINEIKSFKEIKNIVKFILFSSVVASIYGLYQHYFLNMRRVKGFSFSLSWGNFTAVLILFTIIYLIWGDLSKKANIFLSVLGLIYILNLIFTESRGAWLGFLVALVILGLLRGRKFLLISLIIVLFIFKYVFSNSSVHRHSQI